MLEKLWDALWARLATEWDVVSQAPLSFVLPLIVAIVIACVLVELFHRESTNALTQRYNFAKERADDYEKRLGGASPTEAAQEIEELRVRIVALEPRRLRANSRAVLISELSKGDGGSIPVIHDMSCNDCNAFAGDLRHAISAARGWVTSAAGVIGTSHSSPTGLGVGVFDLNNPHAEARSVFSALTESGLNPSYIRRGGLSDSQVHLLVTARLA